MPVVWWHGDFWGTHLRILCLFSERSSAAFGTDGKGWDDHTRTCDDSSQICVNMRMSILRATTCPHKYPQKDHACSCSMCFVESKLYICRFNTKGALQGSGWNTGSERCVKGLCFKFFWTLCRDECSEGMTDLKDWCSQHFYPVDVFWLEGSGTRDWNKISW